jgi:hypothetical protein
MSDDPTTTERTCLSRPMGTKGAAWSHTDAGRRWSMGNCQE